MKKMLFEKFKDSVVDSKTLKSISGGYSSCSCSYFGGAFTESGSCPMSASACASAGQNKYGSGSGTCICIG